MFDDCKSFAFSLASVFIFFTDVEHAAEEHGRQPHANLVVPAPQLQYEGFEPSPYEKNDARADIEQIVS